MVTSTRIKSLAIAGSFLVWLPILLPILLAITSYVRSSRFLFDYLIPAELFPLALLGGGLLVWAASLMRSYRKLIIRSFSIAVSSLIAGQLLAVVTGLASGEIGPSGWQWILVMLSIIMYILALIGMGIGGLLLLKKCSVHKS